VGVYHHPSFDGCRLPRFWRITGVLKPIGKPPLLPAARAAGGLFRTSI